MPEIRRLTRRATQALQRRGLRGMAKKTIRFMDRRQAERRYMSSRRLTDSEKQRQRNIFFSPEIRFTVAVPLYNTPLDVLAEMIDSVQAQTYENWELCLADGSDAEHANVEAYCREKAATDPRIRYQKLDRNGGISENSNAAVNLGTGEYIALLDHDDLLMPDALYEMRQAIAQTGADFLYSDETIFRSPDPRRIVGIRFKPGFSPDTLLTNNYICHLTVFSRVLWQRTGGFRPAFDGSQDHDLFLRMTDQARGIAHVAKVLYLWRSLPGSVAEDINSKRYTIDAGRRAVQDFLHTRRGIMAEVESTEVFPTMFQVRYPIVGKPRVRVILGSDGASLERIQELQSRAEWDTCTWVTTGKSEIPGCVHIIPLPGESRRDLWTRAAAGSEEYLLFLSEIPSDCSEGWLRELLSLAQLSHVGAVSPRVCFPDHLIRMAGVALGLGSAGLAGRIFFQMDALEPEDSFGYLAVVEDVAAVTDVFMISREKWLAVGGFAPEYTNVLFDVDFCLRLLEKGYYNLYTPHACLEMENEKQLSIDVGRESSFWERDADVFRTRNEKRLLRGDPYFPPAFSRKHADRRVGSP